MKNNNYTSFFKTKPKKVERYIRCRKCGGRKMRVMSKVIAWRPLPEPYKED